MPQRDAILNEMDIPQWQLRSRCDEVETTSQSPSVEHLAIASAPAEQLQDAQANVQEQNVNLNPAEMDWATLADTVSQCTRCDLCHTRTQTVFGSGSQQADLMIVGEAPGETEDQRGEPFLGAAGQLLDKMLHAIELHRDQLYIANTLKCRPPSNRNPSVDELAKCSDYLDRQITLLQPKLILALGKVAAQRLTGRDDALGKMRDQLHTHAASNTTILVSYHPAYLLRSPDKKRQAWEDLKRVRTLLAQPSSES